MKNISYRKKLILSLLILLPFLALVFTNYQIYKNVKNNCVLAKNKYKENCVDALIKFIKSDDETAREKNSAIWALGQLTDKAALPVLYDLDKSLPEQEKCSYDKYLCKYEVEKAIRWCEKGNITGWMYKNREAW